MMSWIKLAFRNLARNKRRSIVTILAATLGFAAVNLFGGFTTYMFVNLRDAFIYAGGNGHLQIYRTGYRQHGTTDPANYLLSAEITKNCGNWPKRTTASSWRRESWI